MLPNLEEHYQCPKCKIPFYHQVPRRKWLKLFFPGLRIRRFFCGQCLKKRYVWVKREHV